MKSSISIGRVMGIPIEVHFTWPFVFLAVTWSTAVTFFPIQFPFWAVEWHWIGAASVSLVLFASVLIHELGHAIVAEQRGIPVERISLFLLGGLAEVADEPESAGDELMIALAGPAASLALALAFGAGFVALEPHNVDAATLSLYVAIINALLAVFNMLPGYPLDGGRVLRAAIWGTTGSYDRATAVACAGGRFFAVVMAAFGSFLAVGGDIANGFWLLLVAWFLFRATTSVEVEEEAPHPTGAKLEPAPFLARQSSSFASGGTLPVIARIMSHPRNDRRQRPRVPVER
ncbi:MAG: site-2 protease family protein [Chloroflexi bacterium]|nr:site-2 protease family protein [Chloroflexota bacterium]